LHFRKSPWQPCGGWTGGVEAGSEKNSEGANAAVQVGGTRPGLSSISEGVKKGKKTDVRR
jgi:hypothetical protein